MRVRRARDPIAFTVSTEPQPLHWGAEALWEQLEPLLPGLSIEVVARIPLQVNRNRYNEGYLQTKAAKLGHWFSQTPVDEQE